MIPSAVLRGRNHLRPGFLLLEALLGIALFAIFITAVGMVLLLGQESSVVGGDRVRAASIAGEALDASRSIRDAGFSSLAAGTHGLSLNTSQNWVFSGVQSARSGSYMLRAIITALDDDWVRVEARTTWKHGYNRSGSVILTTELTDWRTARPAGDWSAVSLDGSVVEAGTPLFNAAAVSGNYVFVAGATTSGGAGLYVYDISNTAAPSRVASSFSLGASGYGLAVKGRTLYVVTDDAAGELRAYNISSPASLSSADLLSSHNLSGSSLATSLSVQGSTLLVGAQQSASFNELYRFDVSSTGSILPVGSLEIGSAVNAVAVTGTAALLATADVAGEMKMISIESGLSVPSGSDYNITGSEQGLSVFATGTAALLGRQKGVIQELGLFNTAVAGGNPPPAPGPWYHEGSGSLVGVAADPAKCYGFLAAASGRKAFQVINMRDTSLPELTTYTSNNGLPRAMIYDVVRDRAYVFTTNAFLILRPSSPSGTCN